MKEAKEEVEVVGDLLVALLRFAINLRLMLMPWHNFQLNWNLLCARQIAKSTKNNENTKKKKIEGKY